jgi:YD repeat-containing protein
MKSLHKNLGVASKYSIGRHEGPALWSLRDGILNLTNHLQRAEGKTEVVEGLRRLIQRLSDVESLLGELSGLLNPLLEELGGLGTANDKGASRRLLTFEGAMANFLGILDRLQGLIDSSGAADKDVGSAAGPWDGSGARGLTVTPHSDGGFTVTDIEANKDGSLTRTRVDLSNDGQMRTSESTRNYDGHGGTQEVTSSDNGAHTTTSQYDSSGRLVHVESGGTAKIEEEMRRQTAALIDAARTGTHPAPTPDPSPAPGEDGSNTGIGSARKQAKLELARESLISISGILRSYLRGSSYHNFDVEVDPNTGLGPLVGIDPLSNGSTSTGNTEVDPNTGIDPLAGRDLSGAPSPTAGPDDVIIDPNVGPTPGQPTPNPTQFTPKAGG